jgi:hypothetical protein
MPDTLTIPEQVTISGDVLYKALVDLEAVEDILLAATGGQDTPLTSMIGNASWTLFAEAFAEPGELPDVDSGLGASLLAAGRSRADEWFNRSGAG